MESRSIGFSLAGLAGVSAIIAALSAKQAARAPDALVNPAASAGRGELIHLGVPSADSVRAAFHHGTALIEDLTRRHVGCSPATAARCAGPRPEHRDSLQVIIASIPDPFDSHLDWAYDAYLEAFRRSFASAGYVPDRYWLPAAADSIRITVDHDTSRAALHEFFPGVLLFRSASPEEHKLALLYLVNELPTAGEHKEAFLTAVRERRLLLSDTATFAISRAVRDTLLVAGPIFSGAAQSLRLAIDDAARFVDPQLTGVRVVTGSATNGRNLHTLSDPPGPIGISFQATLNSDDAMRKVLSATIDDLGLRNDQVAILSESSTQYGTQSLSSPWLGLTFPLNIASLRNEVGDGGSDAGPAAIPGLGQSARTRLELRDESRPRENPSVVSALTVPVLELMLGEIVQTLVDHEIRAVVIQASDIRDQLLLAREIRRRDRDVQIITFQAHRLLLRPEYAAQLNGTLVLTSYPLFLENQWWSRGGDLHIPRELLTLSNDAALGTFNSLLTLLHHEHSRIEYDSPLSSRTGPATPPVWLTAVANNAFVPITVTSADPTFQTYFGADAGLPHDRPASLDASGQPHAVATIAVTLLGVLLLVSCTLVVGTRRPIPAPRRHAISAREVPYRRVESHALIIHERIYATLLVIALSGMFIPVATTLLLVRPDSVARLSVWIVATIALPIVALGVVDVLRLIHRGAGDGYRYAMYSPEWRTARDGTSQPRGLMRSVFQTGLVAQIRWLGEVVGRGVIAIVGLLQFALTLTYVVQLRQLAVHDRPRFLLFAYRALQGLSGVSPLLPLMLCGAGFAIWSAWQWRVTHRLYSATTATEEVALAHARSARGRALTDPLSRATAFIDEARASLFRIHPTGGGFAITALLLVVGLLIRMQYVGSMERLVLQRSRWPVSYDLLFWLSTYSMLVTGCWALYRIASTWSALQSALVALSETPIYNAFSRLPRHVSKLTRLSIFASSEHAATVETISERWREFRRQLVELRDQLQQPSAAALSGSDRQAAAAMLRVTYRHPTDRAFSGLEKRERMRHIRRTACALRAAWSATATSPALEGSAPLEQRPPIKPISVAMRTAEEFMAIECVRYVESVLHDLRLLASFLLMSLLLSVALLSSYPFQPQGIVKLAFVALLVGTVVVLFIVMTQMSRDDVLSGITRTDPGKVSWDTTLVLNLALFGVIPLLALVSSEFPSVRAFLFSWAEPLVRSLVKV